MSVKSEVEESVENIEWKKKEKNVLVIHYTLSCALSCDFCCYDCSPRRKEKMDYDFAIDLIRQASKIDSISSIGFTGGEPLYYLDEALGLFEECYRNSMSFTLATACHWAKDKSVALSVLTKMKKYGLSRLNISADYSHQKFVPLLAVENAVQLASELGIETYVVGTFSHVDDSLETYLEKCVDLPSINFVSKYVAKTGRAEDWEISQERYGLDLNINELSCYRRKYHDIVVWHDGTVYPCCSTFNRKTDGIRVGNAYQESLETIIARLDSSSKFNILKRQGFGALLEIIGKYDDELLKEVPDCKECVGPCSFCNAIFSNQSLTAKIDNILASYEADKLIDVIEKLDESTLKALDIDRYL